MQSACSEAASNGAASSGAAATRALLRREVKREILICVHPSVRCRLVVVAYLRLRGLNGTHLALAPQPSFLQLMLVFRAAVGCMAIGTCFHCKRSPPRAPPRNHARLHRHGSWKERACTK